MAIRRKKANQVDIKALKCESCGGDLALVKGAGDQLYGQCQQCDSNHLIKDLIKHTIVVEHKNQNLIQSKPIPTKAVVLISLLFAIGVLALLLMPTFTNPKSQIFPTANPTHDVIFAMGGEGAGTGQFRKTPDLIGIDSQNNAYLEASNRVQVIDGEGKVIASWINTDENQSRRKLYTVLPNGNIIAEGVFEDANFLVLNGKTGELVTTFKLPKFSWDNEDLKLYHDTIAMRMRTDGKLFVYMRKDNAGTDGYEDVAIVIDQELNGSIEKTDLLSKYLIFLPEIDSGSMGADVRDVEVDADGYVYLLVDSSKENDPRQGIYKFTPQYELEQVYKIPFDSFLGPAIEVDGSQNILVNDVWNSEILIANKNGEPFLDLKNLKLLDVTATDADQVDQYPNGDLGIVTGEFYMRVRDKEAQ